MEVYYNNPKVNSLVYCAKVREYWSIDDKLGYGFEAVTKLMEEVRDED